MSIQVEFHGTYSAERVRELGTYMASLTYTRLMFTCFITPLPSLALSAMIETAPLADPEDGVNANWVFWIRTFVTIWFVNGCSMTQMGQYVPRLNVKMHHVVIIAGLAAIVATVFTYVVAVVTVFPVPFTALVATPPTIGVILAFYIFCWKSQWQADASLRHEIKRRVAVMVSEISLTYVYPWYILGFVSLSGTSQALFAVVLPIIKLISKNLISRILDDQNDVKPEIVVFNIEVFSSLYVSSALQNASSSTSTAVIMILDLAQLWLSMLDVVQILKKVKKMMKTIPREHPAVKMNFIQIALSLLQSEPNIFASHAKSTLETSVVEKWVNDNKSEENKPSLKDIKISKAHRIVPAPLNNSQRHNIRGKGVQTLPAHSPPSPHLCALPACEKAATAFIDSVNLRTIFSRDEQALFLRKTAHVLFITEYLVLTEFTEVIVPFIYSLHRIILFRLPNCRYYPLLVGLSSDQFSAAIENVLLYSCLELASLVAVLLVLRRKLGVSPLGQLAFVLESQGRIQAQLILWFVYILQTPLMHLGTSTQSPYTLQRISALGSCGFETLTNLDYYWYCLRPDIRQISM